MSTQLCVFPNIQLFFTNNIIIASNRIDRARCFMVSLWVGDGSADKAVNPGRLLCDRLFKGDWIMLDIRGFEAMAMLGLQDDEREMLGERIEALSESFCALGSIDTDGVEPLVSVLSMCNVMREDAAVKHFSRDEILANAPETYDGYFQVPGTLE